MTTDNL